MQILKKHFSSKLKEAMALAGVKQKDVADHLDVEYATVSRWVGGLDLPKDDRVAPLAAFLKVTPEFFIQPGSHLTLPDAAALIEPILMKTNLKPALIHMILALVTKDKSRLAKVSPSLRLLVE